MSTYADLIERLVEGKSSYIDPLARDLWNRDGFAARDAISRLEREKAELRELIEDAMPILDVLIDDREHMIGEECEVARDLRSRFAEALSRTQEPPHAHKDA